MSREIKFRAWDGNMIHPNVVIVDGTAYKRVYIATIFSKNAKAGVAMQYTGLTDKNGVEIYEGDILKLNNHGDVVWVQFWQGEFITMVVFKGKYTSRCEYDSTGLNMVNHFCEVIGNVHENPELLERESK